MIKVICVGKLKEKYLKDAVNEYAKRISRYIKMQIIEVEDRDLNDIEKGLFLEKESILKYINKRDYIIILDIRGENLNSNKFAEKLEKIIIENANITFIIGGSNGLHHDIKQISNYKLSFSKMTFPHQLFRVILLEQIYRAFKISNNESYHK